MSITTKKGDSGQTDIKSKRVSKKDPLIQLIGELDELSSSIILAQARYHLDLDTYKAIVEDIYHISSYLSGYRNELDLDARVHFFEDFIKTKENKTHAFIFPFNDEVKAQLHLLRAQVRKVERLAVEVITQNSFDLSIVKYINRLSDYIFALEL